MYILKVMEVNYASSSSDMLKMVSSENIHSEISAGFSVGKEEW